MACSAGPHQVVDQTKTNSKADQDLEELRDTIRRGDELLSRSDTLLQQQRKVKSVPAAVESLPSITEEDPD